MIDGESCGVAAALPWSEHESSTSIFQQLLPALVRLTKLLVALGVARAFLMLCAQCAVIGSSRAAIRAALFLPAFVLVIRVRL